MWQLLNAFSAEQQAIAIYEAQVFWRPRASGAVFREVLAEEHVHRLSIEPFMGTQAVVLMMSPFNVLIGWIFGSFLSLLPRKICYEIHVWAEEEAAKTYEQTAKKIPLSAPLQLREALAHAAHQEREHASRFRDLLEELS
jgi:rubrerythrin